MRLLFQAIDVVMFNYLEDRYSLLNNLPVLKLDFGLGIFKCNGPNEYFFSPRYISSEMKYHLNCMQMLKDIEALLSEYKVAHIGRRREVKYQGKRLINNIQCNFKGYAYTLPMGLKHILNQQNIVPIILIPNRIDDMNDSSKIEYSKLNILNLKNMIKNSEILRAIEDNYYDDFFKEQTADLSQIKPLGKLVDKG